MVEDVVLLYFKMSQILRIDASHRANHDKMIHFGGCGRKESQGRGQVRHSKDCFLLRVHDL